MTGALNQRLRPLGHATLIKTSLVDHGEKKLYFFKIKITYGSGGMGYETVIEMSGA